MAFRSATGLRRLSVISKLQEEEQRAFGTRQPGAHTLAHVWRLARGVPRHTKRGGKGAVTVSDVMKVINQHPNRAVCRQGSAPCLSGEHATAALPSPPPSLPLSDTVSWWLFARRKKSRLPLLPIPPKQPTRLGAEGQEGERFTVIITPLHSDTGGGAE